MQNRQAVIIIGSNSTRLLAAVGEELLDPVRAREDTRLFAALGEEGMLSEEGMDRTVDAVARLQHIARSAGAEKVYLAATSATRDAANRLALEEALLNKTGLKLQLLSGGEEARLSFLGATMGQTGVSGVIDIGGGSTEVAVGEKAPRGISLQLGARRMLTMQRVDSPEDAHLAVRAADARLAPLDALFMERPGPVERWFIVGGTGTTLARMLLKLPFAAPIPEGFAITRGEAERVLHMVAALPSMEREKLPGLPKERVDIMPTGIAILLALMDRAHIHSVNVTERNNTDGFLIADILDRQGRIEPCI